MNSREEWNSILSGCAICCWIFAQEMLQFAHSHSGLFCKITIGIQVPKCCDTQFPAIMFTMFDQTGKTLHFIKKSKLLPGDFQIARDSLRLPPHREEVLSSGFLHYRGPWNDSIAPDTASGSYRG